MVLLEANGNGEQRSNSFDEWSMVIVAAFFAWWQKIRSAYTPRRGYFMKHLSYGLATWNEERSRE
jgi:hypothetical protein